MSDTAPNSNDEMDKGSSPGSQSGLMFALPVRGMPKHAANTLTSKPPPAASKPQPTKEEQEAWKEQDKLARQEALSSIPIRLVWTRATERLRRNIKPKDLIILEDFQPAWRTKLRSDDGRPSRRTSRNPQERSRR